MAETASAAPPPTGFSACLQTIWKGTLPRAVPTQHAASARLSCAEACFRHISPLARRAEPAVSPRTVRRRRTTVLVYLEDKLADLFGLNTPKYYWALEELEYRQRKVPWRPRRAAGPLETACWSFGLIPVGPGSPSSGFLTRRAPRAAPPPNSQEKEEAARLAEREHAADGASGSGSGVARVELTAPGMNQV